MLGHPLSGSAWVATAAQKACYAGGILSRHQLEHPHQIVCIQAEDKHPIDLDEASVARVANSARRVEPALNFRISLANDIAE